MQKLELRKFLEELDWSGCQEITIFGARCYIVEHPLGGVFILAPLAKVAPRKSYDAEDVPNARTRA